MYCKENDTILCTRHITTYYTLFYSSAVQNLTSQTVLCDVYTVFLVEKISRKL